MSKLCGSVPLFVITNWMQPAGTVVCERLNVYSTMPTVIVAVGLVHAAGFVLVVVVVVVVAVVVVAVVVDAVVVVETTVVVPPPPPPPPPPPVTVGLPVIVFGPQVHVHVKRPAELKATLATVVRCGITFVRFTAT